MNPQPTVMTEQFEGHANALRMTWQQRVDPLHVRPAFERIVSALDAAHEPIYVVVDLLRDPKFPLAETMMQAIGAYRHPMLAEWLIIGGNRGAKAIEGFLSRFTGRQNVRWFDTEADTLAYLQTVRAAAQA